MRDAAAILLDPAPDHDHLRSLRRTFLLLWREGFLTRLPHFDLDTEGVNYVYGLSDKALKTFDLGRLAKTFDEHSARTLDHELGITTFHIALKRFCHDNRRTLFWQQRDLKRGIHPDALFALTDPSKPEGQNTHYFFVEIERAKLGQYRTGEPAILRKLERYAQYFGSDQCDRDWNFRAFRVVAVLTTDERAAFLLRVLSERLPHRAFWITSAAYAVDNLAGPVFRTPSDHKQQAHSLLSL